MLDKYDLNQIDNKIVQWSHDTGLATGSTVDKQSHKYLEEFTELIAALNPEATPETIVHIIHGMLVQLLKNNRIKSVMPEDALEAQIDAIGDMDVVGTVMLEILRTSKATCLNGVYEIISKRTKGGRLINGNFVKKEDLPDVKEDI